MPIKISIIIPAYNQAEFIREALNSVFDLNISNQLIVVNDGSTDDTAQVLLGYSDRIEVISQPNLGVNSARNAGLKIASGEFICLLDADDVVHVDGILQLVHYLDNIPNCDVACGLWDYIDAQGKQITRPSLRFAKNFLVKNDWPSALLIGKTVPIHSLLIRRSCFDRAGMFNETMHFREDSEMWLRMVDAGCKFVFLPYHVASYRLHATNRTQQNFLLQEQSQLTLLDTAFIKPRSAKHTGFLKEFAYAWAYINLGFVSINVGDSTNALIYVKKSLRWYEKTGLSRYYTFHFLKHFCYLSFLSGWARYQAAKNNPALNLFFGFKQLISESLQLLRLTPQIVKNSFVKYPR